MKRRMTATVDATVYCVEVQLEKRLLRDARRGYLVKEGRVKFGFTREGEVLVDGTRYVCVLCMRE
jgi:hypothetical protein